MDKTLIKSTNKRARLSLAFLGKPTIYIGYNKLRLGESNQALYVYQDEATKELILNFVFKPTEQNYINILNYINFKCMENKRNVKKKKTNKNNGAEKGSIQRIPKSTKL